MICILCEIMGIIEIYNKNPKGHDIAGGIMTCGHKYGSQANIYKYMFETI